MNPSSLKQSAAEAAAGLVEDGMTVGLGTGSTADFATRWLAQYRKNLRVVPTSVGTAKLARDLGLNLVSPGSAPQLDILIDGADECTEEGDMIKGGGGALLREKLVALRAVKRLYVMDASKIVDRLGTFPLPVEAVSFGWEWTQELLETSGFHPVLRVGRDGHHVMTDNSNVIFDCHLGKIQAPSSVQARILDIPGVVETGFFLGIATMVFVGETAGVRRFQIAL